MRIRNLLLVALLLPTCTFANGISVTKDKFTTGFCEYLNNPDVNTESHLCPIKIESNGQVDGNYIINLPNGSYVEFDTDTKNSKVTKINFMHSTDIAGSDDVMQTRFAIIYAIDNALYKNHNESFYNLISSRKAMRAGMNVPVGHNSLTHNGILYTYAYNEASDDFSFQLNNK